jgi:hypothetical protein
VEISSGLIPDIKKHLQDRSVIIQFADIDVTFRNGNRHITFSLKNDDPLQKITGNDEYAGEKIASIILSRLGLNRRVYARDCDYKVIDKKIANTFLDRFHLMKSTGSAFTRGLFLKEELLAVASFSKGRKMRRLKEDERSYELIRFCCVSGVSISGGLSKLVKNFCREKKAGDIMSYVDSQLSDGRSFVNAGFTKIKESDSNKNDKPLLSHKLIYTCKSP